MKNLIPSFLRLRLSVFGAGLIMLTAAAAAVWMRSATAGRAPISTGAPARYDSSKGIIPAALTMTVNSLGDADDINIGDGICDSDAGTAGNQCTLRAAIQETNAAAAGDDVINFSLPAGNPITLNSALPDIGGNLAINGPGAATLTVQRNPAAGTPDFRIFNIGLGTTVSVSGLTVANGKLTGANNGGGVINQGALTLTNCDFFGNAAQDGGAIFNNGTSLILVGCHVGGTLAGQANTALGAGGIWHNSGTLTMTGGSVVGNTGGAMFAGQPVTLDSVAITDNVNDGRGGGIFVFNSSTIVNCLIANNSSAGVGGGGGIYYQGGTNTLANTTISGNVADDAGGGLWAAGTTTLTNVTITNNRTKSLGSNGGGLIANGTTNLRNTIVVRNFQGASGFGVSDISGTVSVSGSFNNLIGNGGSGGLFNSFNGNLVGVTSGQVGPLANNGGATMTHALVPGSLALDAGSNAFITNPPFTGSGPFTDQRGPGFKRILDAADVNDTTQTVDIGALEANPMIIAIPNATFAEDFSPSGAFMGIAVGDDSEGFTSIVATSSNQSLLKDSNLDANVPNTPDRDLSFSRSSPTSLARRL